MNQTEKRLNVVLLMDDIRNGGVATLVAQFLEARGHAARPDGSLRSAAEAVEKAQADVVVIDQYWLAKIGGAGVRTLRAAAGAETRLVFVVEQPRDMSTLRPLREREATLPCPFTARQLIQAVETGEGVAIRRRYQPNIQTRGLPA